MSHRYCTLTGFFAALVTTAGSPGLVLGQAAGQPAQRSGGQVAAQAARNAGRPESLLLSALRANPVTAPYAISATRRNGVIVLAGRVGTKQIHDVAVRMAIDLGAPFRDDLVIDTAAADQAALMSTGPAAAAGPLAQGTLASSPYIYPPPLMGRLDDPFFGLVPPIVSFPPWWRRNDPALVEPRTTASGGVAPQPPAERGGSEQAGVAPAGAAPAIGKVEIRVDPLGQVFLSGVVASEEARREIEQTARSVPGVTRVESQFQVQPRRAESETPPPPPQPMLGPAAAEPAARPAPAVARSPKLNPATVAPTAVDSSGLSRRIVAALERRPAAAVLPIKVRSNNGAVTLSGPVPSAYEAMIAYRAAQQTPGVKEIVDQLEFPVPDEDHPNPLVQKGRPEDVEPYLASQIRRHFGDLAQLDRIQARGNLLELHGTLQNPADKDRVLAILRSMPLLTGFQIEPAFTSE
ncbi:MAG TPA: BON domain-containing protein [Isosphaeraceae bacterium]|nr:BON domain-containing protein [Isosphaeraceae bacterium]